MLMVELVPDISHCIETVAKKEYKEIIRQVLASGEDNKELSERIELLRVFLETTDFKRLRRESEEHLVNGRTVKFVLHLENGIPRYKMIVT
jgi:hypothetical protein